MLHRSADRILRPDIQTLSGDLLLVAPEVAGNVATDLSDISNFVNNNRDKLKPNSDGYLFDDQFLEEFWKKPGSKDEFTLNVLGLFTKIDEIVTDKIGPYRRTIDAVASLRILDHRTAGINAEPHIDEFDENINSLRVVAAWPNNTQYLNQKRIGGGVTYGELFQKNGLYKDSGSVGGDLLKVVMAMPWIQADPGDVMMFSGVATIHKEPEVTLGPDMPRVLATMTFIDFNEGIPGLLTNPYTK